MVRTVATWAAAFFLLGPVVPRARAEPSSDPSSDLSSDPDFADADEAELKRARGVRALAIGDEIGRRLTFKEPDRARKLMRIALERGQGDYSAIGRLHKSIGNTFLIQDSLDAAEAEYGRALEAFRKVDDLDGLIGTKLNLGIVARRRGDLAEAIQQNREVIRINERIKDARWTERASNNLGVIFNEAGLTELSLEHLLRAREAALELGNTQSSAFWNAARRSAKLGNIELADQLMAEARSAPTSDSDSYWEGSLLSAQGFVDLHAGRFEAAEKAYAEAHLILEKTGSANRAAWAQCGLVRARMELGRTSGLEALVRSCRRAAITFGNTRQLIDADQILVRLLRDRHRHEEAARLAEENAERTMELFTSQNKQRVGIAVADIEEEFNRQAVKIAEQEAEVSRLVAQRQRIFLVLAGVAILSLALVALTLVRNGRARSRANVELSQARDRVEAQNGQLAEAVSQREVLLRELNHRVKNNLQVIASLLGLERRRAEAEGASVEYLKNVQARVISMASIHEGLQAQGSADEVRLDDYLERLAERLANVYGERCEISIRTTLSRTVTLSDAAPIGLIICELVSNAEKHAYGEEDEVHVSISLESSPSGAVLRVSDQGIGVENESRLQPTESLGLALVYDLARQVGAKLSWAHNQPQGLMWMLELAR